MSTEAVTDSYVGKVLNNPHRAIEIVGLLVLILIPVLYPPSDVQTWAIYLLFCLLALSIDLVWGYTGLLTLGHAAYFGAGAYLTAKVTTEIPAIPETVVVFVLAPLFGALLTLLVGWFLFSADVKGAYFAIATLIISVIAGNVVQQFTEFLGGFNGLSGIPTLSIGSMEFSTIMEYYTALIVLVGVYIGSRWLTTSAFGRALKGIREDQLRTEAFGYDTELCRLLVFTISGGIAGVAGGLYATLDGFVSPPIIGFVLATEVVIWVAVGGRGTLLGAVAGALLIQFLESELSSALLNFWEIILAAVFITVVILAPGGIMGAVDKDSRAIQWLQNRLVSNTGSPEQQMTETTKEKK